MRDGAHLPSLRTFPQVMRSPTECRTPRGGQFDPMKSMKMIWACLAVVTIVVVVVLASDSGGYALFAVGCIAMMGAMAWMMMGGPRGGSRSRRHD